MLVLSFLFLQSYPNFFSQLILGPELITVQTFTSQDIQLAKKLLLAGSLVAIPTETVYGLAALGLDPVAVQRIFQVKGRPSYDPVILHVDTMERIKPVVTDFPEPLLTLARHFWPGPLTLLLPKSDLVPEVVTAGLPRVGVRIPNHPMTLELLSALQVPLAAPSANPFGYVSPTLPEHVWRHFAGRIAMILDGGPCLQGIESTIVGLEAGRPVVYRLGSLSVELIESTIGPVKLVTHSSSQPEAPGMLTRHYAPQKLVVVVGDLQEMNFYKEDKTCAMITFTADLGLGTRSVWLSPSFSLEEAAANFYRTLQSWDLDAGIHTLVIEKFPETAQGRALNDKLRRAAKL